MKEKIVASQCIKHKKKKSEFIHFNRNWFLDEMILIAHQGILWNHVVRMRIDAQLGRLAFFFLCICHGCGFKDLLQLHCGYKATAKALRRIKKKKITERQAIVMDMIEKFIWEIKINCMFIINVTTATITIVLSKQLAFWFGYTVSRTFMQ